MLQGEHSAILRPSLSYHLSLRSSFCIFLSGRLRQVLLYIYLDFVCFISGSAVSGDAGLPVGAHTWWSYLYASGVLLVCLVVCLVGGAMFAKTSAAILLVGIVELLCQCKGGNFNDHIWVWFRYFIYSRREIMSVLYS